jgi:hypothetical protein
VRFVSVSWERSWTGERRQGRSCLFRREYFRNGDSYTEETVLGLSPGEDGSCNSENRHGRRREHRRISFLARRVQEVRQQTRKLSCVQVWARSSDVRFRDDNIMIFNDIYRMIRPMVIFRAMKIYKNISICRISPQ